MNISRKAVFDRVARKEITPEEARRLLAQAEHEQPAPAPVATATAGPDDIAVVGMAARFPGAPDLTRFWANLCDGVDAVTEIPETRQALRDLYHPDPNHPGTSHSRWGAFLDNIDCFDPSFFNISAAEAEIMDPQQRLFLEAAWHALEDAAINPRTLAGRPVGVFMGAKSTRYLDHFKVGDAGTQPLASRMLSVMPGRLSYLLDLKGPSIVVDSECSSSLVAIHQACQALHRGDCETALAGGISLLLDPELFVTMSKAQMLSPNGRCATFDAAADGIVMGEGLGIVVLKPLARAVADRDAVYAVIRASVLNQDGKTNGITAPNTLSQINLARASFTKAQLDPAQLGYMECHGTGTSLGDPIEVGALTTVFRERGAGDAKVPLGSIKTNFGHTLLAAGVAGFIKAALAVHHGVVPPSLHFSQENPKLELAQSPFFVADKAVPFAQPARYAGVSAFGASGTNSQILLGPAPAAPDANRDAGPQLFLFSGRTEQALQDNVAAVRDWLQTNKDAALADVAYTLAVGRARFRNRLALIASSADELIGLLNAFTHESDGNGRWWIGKTHAAAKDAAVDALLQQCETARRVPRAFHALLSRVAQADVAGAALDWATLFPPARHRRVHLPGYRFQHQRFWIETPAAEETPHAEAGARVLDQSAWYLADHIINGRAILPGVVHIHHFLENARRCLDVADSRAVVLENLNWAAPLVVAGSAALHCDLNPDGDDAVLAVLRTQAGRHSQARCRRMTVTAPAPVDLDAVRAACPQRIQPETLYETFRAGGIHYGPGFKVVQSLVHNQDSALAELALPSARRADLAWSLHPALLDGAFQSLTPLMPDSTQGETWLPFAVKRITHFGALPERVWALAQAHGGGDARLRRFELYLVADDGTVLVHLHAFAVRAVGANDEAGTETLLMEARRTSIPTPSGPTHFEQPVLVLQNAGAPLADVLRRAGSRQVIAIQHGAAWSSDGDTLTCDLNDEQQLRHLAAELAALTERPAAFIDALVAEDAPTANHTSAWLNAALSQRLLLLQALWRLPNLRHTRFLYLYPANVDPALEALAGWYRTLFREKPEWQPRVLAYGGPVTALSSSLPALANLPNECERELFRDADGHWSARRLYQAALAPTNGVFARDEHHLVSGGAGGIGLLVAEHLAVHHGCRVTLLGRSPLRDTVNAKLNDWRRRGARVQYVRADIGDETALAPALTEAKNNFGPLHGLHHCAGLIRDNYIVRKPRTDLAAVLHPKVAGTLALDRLTRDQPLRCFVLHSAVTAVLGNAGQSDYAVANRFLDAFAAQRNRQDAPGRCVAVNWPLWRDGGMNVPDEVWAAMRANAGVTPLDSRDGLRHIEEALRAGADSLVSCSSADTRKLARYLRAQGCPVADDSAAPTTAAAATTATATPNVDSTDLVGYVADHLVQLLAAQTKIDPAQIDLDEELDVFGLDSIGAMQITDALETITGSLPKTLFFEHPNLRSVAVALCESHGDQLAAALAPNTATAGAPLAAATTDTPALTWTWLRALLAAETKLAEEVIDIEAPLDELGLDSIMAMNVTSAMEERLGSLSKTLFFEHNTAGDLVATLARDHAETLAQAFAGAEPAPLQSAPSPPAAPVETPVSQTSVPTYPVKKTPTHIRAGRDGSAETVDRDSHDIAVIAVDGRYPLADDLDSFWHNLRSGRDCIREIPAERWDPRDFDGILADRRSCKWGGFMDNIDRFDPMFFNIPPREAALLDPQERLLLETAWRTFENAGYARQRLQSKELGGQVGVYIATMYPEYLMLGLESALRGEAFFTNSTFASFANRISYFFNLRGPSITLDTMCSGSLTAVCQAVDALRRGACRMALAGGVSLILHPYRYVLLARGHFFSSDGRCRGFGEGGDGYVPGEGVGTVLLKRLVDARADGDPILAVIRGAAVNHGGRTNGYTVPNPVAQAELIQAALQDAAVDPNSISYVEAHGTGTALGDPIEIAGLNRAFGELTGNPAMGTVKSNIGHLEPAAGIAGLTKVLLQMKHRELVPTLHTDTPNRHIDWSATPFRLQREVGAWQSKGPLRAAISSFGAGGSNAHLILEAPPADVAVPTPVISAEPALITLSARTETAIVTLAKQLVAYLNQEQPALDDVVWTLQHRELMPVRAAVVAVDRDALRAALVALAEQREAPHLVRGTVEPGQAVPGEAATDVRDAAQRFCAGAAVDHSRFGRRGRWLALPNYPFEARRCWVDFKAGAWPKNKQTAAVPARVGHPLIGAAEPSLQAGISFAISLDPNAAFLDEHRVRDRRILPGVAVLEMLRAAVAQLVPTTHLGAVHDLVWLQPLGEDTTAPVRLHLHAGDGDRIQWRFVDGAGRDHARGSLSTTPATPPANVDAAALAHACGRHFDAAYLYPFFREHNLHYGAHFQTVTRLYISPGRVVGLLQLQGRAGLDDDALTPGLLDGMLQSALGLVLGREQTPPLMVPFAIGSVTFHQPPPDQVWVVIDQVAAPDNGHLRFNAQLVDDQGRVCLSFREIASRRLDAQPTTSRPASTPVRDGAVADDLFVPFWSQETPTQTQPINGSLVVLHQGRHDGIQAALQSAVADVVFHNLAEQPNVTQLVQQHAQVREWLVVLPPAPAEQLDAASLRVAEQAGVLTMLDWIKNLAGAGLIQGLRFRFVTHDLQRVAADDRADTRYGAVPGFTKACAHEFPGIRSLCADLAGNLYDNADAARETWSQLLADPIAEPAREIAWRQGLRFVKRLRALQLPNTQNLPLQRGAVIVVIGGHGGLGVVFSKCWAERYGARLVWVGRRAEDDAVRANMQAVRALGGEVRYFSADMTDRDALDHVRRETRAAYGRIDGVVHSAIVMRDGALTGFDTADFRAALDPKAVGTLAIEQIFGSDEHTWIAYFSSANGFMGNPGQGNYTAGCTFKDLYVDAVNQNAKTRRWVIDWGYWGETGIVQDARYRDQLAKIGIVPLTNQQGIDALDRILAYDVSPVLAIRARAQLLQKAGVHQGRHVTVVNQTTPLKLDRVNSALSAWQAGENKLDLEPYEHLEREVAPAVYARLAALDLPQPGQRFSADALAERLALLPKYGGWLRAWLADMAHQGLAEWDGDYGTFVTAPPAAGEAAIRQVGAQFREVTAHAELLAVAVARVDAIVTGAVAATDVMFPNASMSLVEAIYRGNAIADYHNRAVCAAVRAAVASADGRPVSILEVGAGTGGTSAAVLAELDRLGAPCNYVYTDLGPGFVQYGKRTFGKYPFVSFQTYDLAQDPAAQGLTRGGFDLVLAANVVHATADVMASLAAIKSLLKRDGLLILNEVTSRRAFSNATFGLLDGWWLFNDAERRVPLAPALAPDQWSLCFGELGYRDMTVVGLPDVPCERLEQAVLVTRSDGCLCVADATVADTPPATAPAAPTAAVAQPAKTKSNHSARLKSLLADVLGCQEAEIHPTRPFSEYGVDSIVAVDLITRINESLGLNLRPTLLFDYNHLNSLAAHLATLTPAAPATPAAPVQAAPVQAAPIQAAQPSSHINANSVTEQLRTILCEVLGCRADEVHPTRPFSEYGVDSIVAVDLITRINERFGLNLRPTLLFDYNHLNSLAAHLAEQAPAKVTPLAQPIAPVTQPFAQAPATAPVHQSSVRDQLIAILCEVLGCRADEVHPTRPFSEYGVDSIVAVDLTTRINETWSLNLRPTLLFDYNHLDSLTRHLSDLAPTTSAQVPSPTPAAAPTAPAAVYRDAAAVLTALAEGRLDVDEADRLLARLAT